MKIYNSCFSFLFLLFFFSNFAQAQVEETKLAVTPSKVTVHLKGAELLQSATAQIPGGRHRVIFTGLSPKVNPQSIQVTATNGVSILSIASKINFLKERKESAQVRILRDSLELLEEQKQGTADELSAFQEESDLLKKNKAMGGKNTALPVDELIRAADFYRARFREINRAVSALKRRMKNINLEVAQLNLQLQEMNAHRRPTSEVYVDVGSEAPVSSEFLLRYVVDDAGWSPIYDLVSTKLNEPISLKYRALAFNDTGVDWEGVSIRLSTADPYAGAGQPSLTPWFLTLQKARTVGVPDRPYEKRNQLDMLQNSQNLNYNFQADLEKDMAQSFITFETIEVSELSTDFDIETPYTIPSDRRPYSIEIKEHKLEANYKHFAIPKIDKDAFLLAQVTGWEGLDLISGPINVYRNENFIGLAQLSTRTLSDTLELSLGRDKNVLVKRTLLKDFSKKQFLGGNKISSLTYRISVKNNHKTPITIEIQDQVPISKNKEIEVAVKEVSGAHRIKTSGKLIWEKTIAPGGVEAVKFGIEIKHPKNMEIKIDKKRQVVSPRFF